MFAACLLVNICNAVFVVHALQPLRGHAVFLATAIFVLNCTALRCMRFGVSACSAELVALTLSCGCACDQTHSVVSGGQTQPSCRRAVGVASLLS